MENGVKFDISLLIPVEKLEKLLSGEYKRYNGVIRDAKTGEIVCHLKEIAENIDEKAIEEALDKASKAGSNKTPLLVGGSIVLVTGATIAMVSIIKWVKKRNIINKFNELLEKYRKYTTPEEVPDEIINELLNTIDKIKNKYPVGSKKKISITWDNLVFLISTSQSNNSNNLEISDLSDNSISELDCITIIADFENKLVA